MTKQNAPMLFENEEFGTVRVIVDANGEPLFCLGDLCKILELQVGAVVTRLSKGISTTNPLEEDAKNANVLTKQPLQTAGGVQKVYFVNLDGLFDAALDSRKPIARKFRKWITSEVLPTIMKTGSYSLPGVQPPAPVDPKRISSVIDELGLTAQKLTEVFGVAKGIALSKATVLVEENYSVNLNAVRGLLPPAESTVGLLNPTQIGKLVYGTSGAVINKVLERLKLQEKINDCYQLTDAGKEYGEMMPYTRNGHSGYRPLWRTSVVDVLKAKINWNDTAGNMAVFGNSLTANLRGEQEDD